MTADRSADDGAAESAVSVGDEAPAFELPGVGADGIDTYSLDEFTDEGALVLSFYPFDFSPVCTEQLCGFREAEWLTFTEEVDVVGVSVDSAYAHQAFRDEYDLAFPLLSDRVAAVADQYGVTYDEWEDHPKVCMRAVFAVDDARTVRYRWIADDAREQPSVDDLRESIAWIE